MRSIVSIWYPKNIKIDPKSTDKADYYNGYYCRFIVHFTAMLAYLMYQILFSLKVSADLTPILLKQ